MESLILIIDDDQKKRELLVDLVRGLGHRTACAESGVEGIKLARKLNPSLVLLDVVMPSFDGFKVAAAIKQLPTFVPVILLTALDDLEARRRGQAAGADDFVSLPMGLHLIGVRIASMLRIKALTEALEDANRRLLELAHTDGLTGLPNRRRFEEVLAAEHARAARYHRSLGVLMVDIDHFKRVNDSRGHAAGDQALRAVGQELARALRNTDTIARMGGEEFAVLAPELTRAGAITLGERLRARVAAMVVEAGGGRLALTVSIGAKVWDGWNALAPAELLAAADEALYDAKKRGRNRVVLASANAVAEKRAALP